MEDGGRNPGHSVNWRVNYAPLAPCQAHPDCASLHPGYSLYKVLGLFIPLIVSSCLSLARLEAFAAKEPVLPSFLDGLFMGIGLTIALTVIGAVREIFGAGTLFADASLLMGPAFKFMEMRLMSEDMGVLMMILPPGGFLVVAKRMIDLE